VRLPEGAFFAWGAAGQYALVIPALDIVVVHRVDRDIPDYKEVNLWQFGRLLWLILSAALS
jgi:CubicO group peptidase (beta-lactamase class C family)